MTESSGYEAGPPSAMASAVEFANSMRGQFIISQALCLGIRTLREVQPDIMREQSNITDMEYLRDTLWPIYQSVEKFERDCDGDNLPLWLVDEVQATMNKKEDGDGC